VENIPYPGVEPPRILVERRPAESDLPERREAPLIVPIELG